MLVPLPQPFYTGARSKMDLLKHMPCNCSNHNTALGLGLVVFFLFQMVLKGGGD